MLITFLLIVIFMIFTTVITIGWFVHISMVKENTKKYGWANYKIFIKEFNKYKWNNENWGRYSLWDRKNNCKFHANIVYFNQIGMIMKTPIDWLLMHLYVIKYAKKYKQNENMNYINYNWYDV